MKPLAHEMAFPALGSDIEQWKEQIIETGTLPMELMEGEQSNDVRRWYILYLLSEGLIEEAKNSLATINRNGYVGTLGGAWLSLADMTVGIELNELSEALLAGEEALKRLAEVEEDRSNPDFIAIVAGVIYNLAMVHHAVGENVRAEKELLKAQKLFEKLAKKD